MIAIDPQKYNEILKNEVVRALQTLIDEFAKTRGYTNALFASSYATSSNPKFAQEGQYIVDARDAMWMAAYEILDEVEAGARPVPSVDEVISEMPVLEWPE